MPVIVNIILFAFLGSVLIIEISGIFCKRPGHICFNGECTEEQTCRCYSGFTGHDCVVPTQYTLNCTNKCSHHGTCFFGDMCYCDYGYYGKNCENKNQTVDCMLGYMYISMATEHYRDIRMLNNPRCQLIMDGPKLLNHTFMYSRRIELEPGPSSPCQGVKREIIGDSLHYTVELEAREQAGQLAPLDYVTRFSCHYKFKSIASRSYDIIKEQTNHSTMYVGIGRSKPVTNEGPTTYNVSLLSDGGMYLSDGVDKTRKFSILFYPLDDKNEHAVDVITLKVYDQKTSKPYITLLENGCRTVFGDNYVDKIFNNVGLDLPDGKRNNVTKITLKPLQQSRDIYIDYTLRLCKGQCATNTCSIKQFPETSKGIRLSIF